MEGIYVPSWASARLRARFLAQYHAENMQSAKRNTQTAVTATISGSVAPFEAETTTGVGRIVEDVVADDDDDVSEAERDCTNVSVAVTTVLDIEVTEMEVMVIMREDGAGVVEVA